MQNIARDCQSTSWLKEASLDQAMPRQHLVTRLEYVYLEKWFCAYQTSILLAVYVMSTPHCTRKQK